MAGITLSELLKKMIEMSGSDLHLSTNSAPRIRVHGKLRPLDMPPLTAADTKALAYSVLTDVQKHRLEENLDSGLSSSGQRRLAIGGSPVCATRGARPNRPYPACSRDRCERGDRQPGDRSL